MNSLPLNTWSETGIQCLRCGETIVPNVLHACGDDLFTVDTDGNIILSDEQPLPSNSLDIYVAPAGGYDLGGSVIALDKKPHRLHRFMVQLALGWRWNDGA